MSIAVERFDHVVVNCRDVEATAAWYERALGEMTSHYCRDVDGNLIEIAVY
ncbi:VOC family protein [Mycobacterium mantenii]|uniref:VOC family protein n=1 Tax=Mycobacterium mantenii TaxID=560555 RepID=UPI000B14F646|nr:VOC family protein [Mycobacterium mantenii]